MPHSISWKEQVDAQQQSGLSGAEYCRKNNLPLKSFYHHRSRLSGSEKLVFVQAKIKPSSSGVASRDSGMVLKAGTCHLHLPSNVSASWLAQLIKAMS